MKKTILCLAAGLLASAVLAGGFSMRYVESFSTNSSITWTNARDDFSVPRMTVTYSGGAVANTSTFYHAFTVGTNTYTNVVAIVGDDSMVSFNALEEVQPINVKKGDSLIVVNGTTNNAPFLHIDFDTMP